MHTTGRDQEKDDDTAPRRPTLLDKQLEEILQTADRTHRRQLFRRRVKGVAGSVLGQAGSGTRVTPGRLIAIGVALWLGALVAGQSLPLLTNVLLLSGLILVGAGFLTSPRGGAAASGPQRIWRGRVIEYRRDDPLAAGKNWFEDLLRRMRRR